MGGTGAPPRQAHTEAGGRTGAPPLFSFTCRRLFDPAAQQPPNLGHHLADVLVLAGGEPCPLLRQPQVEPQLVQVSVGVRR